MWTSKVLDDVVSEIRFRSMAHVLFNFSNPEVVDGSAMREQATELLRARMWGVAVDEPHRSELAPGDFALVYLAPPECAFIGRAEIVTAVHVWTPSEAEVYPGDLPSGVVISHVEEWEPPVPMGDVIQRVDPTGSNPYVQENARSGFQIGVVRITAHEYNAVLEVWAERLPSTD